MRWLVLMALLSGCGGSQFQGDNITAVLIDGQPNWEAGRTGPRISVRTATVPLGNGSTYEQQIIRCDWTCAKSALAGRAAVYVEFHTDEAGRWIPNTYVDPKPENAACPTD